MVLYGVSKSQANQVWYVPPGSGKSMVCLLVAVEWLKAHDSGNVTVLLPFGHLKHRCQAEMTDAIKSDCNEARIRWLTFDDYAASGSDDWTDLLLIDEFRWMLDHSPQAASRVLRQAKDSRAHVVGLCGLANG